MQAPHDGSRDKIAHLLRIVERLNEDDQQRICRIVGLLAMVPAADQDETVRMLRLLLDDAPNTRFECSSRVDEVIEFLEARTVSYDDACAGHNRYAETGPSVN